MSRCAPSTFQLLAIALAIAAQGGCSLILSFDEEMKEGAAVDAGPRMRDSGGGFVDAAIDGGLPTSGDACVADSWVSLLQNGGLDAATADPWVQSSANGGSIIRDPVGFNPHNGSSKLAIFTWGDIKSMHLRQAVDIPPMADAVRLSGYLCFIASEAGVVDTLDLELREEGEVLVILHQYSNADASEVCSWSSFSFTAEGSVAGKSLELGLEASYAADQVAQTTFLFDSLKLEARVCGQ